ncbi:MAG TPA: hydrogenase maturation nickel metallochaperone HypA [Terriglobales bacterium]|nr:hydrogenase maturation nickel metallochaperone HypA [Terriglobales bacterium]
MHELSIAESILDAVERQAADHPDARFHKIGLRIGELSGIDADALNFSWHAVTQDTSYQQTALEIEFCPRRHRCEQCGQQFTVHDYRTDCPRCRDTNTTCIGGEELDIAYLEVEE